MLQPEVKTSAAFDPVMEAVQKDESVKDPL
jgi:hypothetical protein